jgi:hypothetical protein
LVVFGTWAASRYLILRKFENIEHNDVARSVEVMRKALVTKNTEIETVSRDFARWDDMYSYVSTLDSNFEYPEFQRGRPRRDECRPGVACSTRKRSSSPRSRTTPTTPAITTLRPTGSRPKSIVLTPLVRSVLDQEGTLRLVQINGVPHVIAAHTILHSDRSGPAAGTLVFARRIGAPENCQHLEPIRSSMCTSPCSTTVPWPTTGRN